MAVQNVASLSPSFLPPARDDVPMVAVAHGTTHLPGLLTLDAIMERVRFLRPGMPVSLSFVSNAEPRPLDVLAELSGQGHREAVVLPMFLTTGYHVRHDIAEAVRATEGRGFRVHTARALGPDPMLAHVLSDRLAAVTGRVFGTEVVLAAAGSKDRRANADAVVMAGFLAERLGMPVRTAYLSATEPTVESLLTRLSRRGRPVAVASYLLAEGGYTQRLGDIAALAGLEQEAVRTPRVAGPLGAHELVARLLVRRYDQALYLK
ncbi:sirohydrochlorin chelatase [Actinospica sp. MGRD01-02]|uniref:Sirohydrochlorin chelatase n=1 Tax=Actinospica acidithermotolerans TaxID=2828514 RepID=A0A941EB96_9ACTN|nr:sirohydrochlorin chelatase [Actinospica acidithermotolerans]MBR7827283.1 sirohydrochlorin chelatase [Actinospica acidithermotolerans]